MADVEERPSFAGEEGESPLLRCPWCGGDGVVPRGVVVRNREREDAHGLVVEVRDHVVSVRHTAIEQNDGRRDSLDIVFDCRKGCGESSVLQLREHRGRRASSGSSGPCGGARLAQLEGDNSFYHPPFGLRRRSKSITRAGEG